MSPDNLWMALQHQCSDNERLCDRPFCDVGEIRTIRWKALGIDWYVQFVNEHFLTAISEEFVATLQVILADLGGEDLCLLPTKALIHSYITDGEQCSIEEEPSNAMICWKIGFPRAWIQNIERLDDLRRQIFALATAVLSQCSVLNAHAFMEKLHAAFSHGLSLKTLAVRPYAELYMEFMTKGRCSKGVDLALDC